MDEIIKRIKSGYYPPGTRLPGVVTLAHEYEVSVITSNRVLEELSRKGFVERKERIGTFVCEHPRLLTEVRVGFHTDSSGMDLQRSDYLLGIMTEIESENLIFRPFTIWDIEAETRELIADPEGKGVIIVDPYSVGPAQKKLAQMNVPFLHIGTDSLDGVHCVSENRSAAASALVAALVEDGHRRIGFVGSLDRPNHRAARDGYLEAIRPLNIGRRYIWDADDKTIHEAMEDIISDPMRPDALLVMGGHLPIGALPILLHCPAPPTLAVFAENSAIVQLRKNAYVAYYSQVETGRLAVRVLAQLAGEEGTPARNHYSPFKILRPGQSQE